MYFWPLVKDTFYWFRNFELWAKALANINPHFTALIINSQINESSGILHDVKDPKSHTWLQVKP